LVLAIGIGASAIATVLFTQAFRHANPTTVILLQKTQPLIAITLAAVWLREPLPSRFWPLLPFALIGTYLISFGDTGPLASIATVANTPLGAAMALGAAALWGAGTALGRRVLARVPFVTLVAMRFAAALPALALISGFGGWAVPTPADIPTLLVLALVAGLAGMLLYYRGLRDTPAAVATLCELSFPITAIIVNFVFLGAAITLNQAVGIVVLWSAIALMRHRPVPPRVPAPVAASAQG
jgi:drug/metabolite transporter (DMT)-like permease